MGKMRKRGRHLVQYFCQWFLRTEVLNAIFLGNVFEPNFVVCSFSNHFVQILKKCTTKLELPRHIKSRAAFVYLGDESISTFDPLCGCSVPRR